MIKPIDEHPALRFSPIHFLSTVAATNAWPKFDVLPPRRLAKNALHYVIHDISARTAAPNGRPSQHRVMSVNEAEAVAFVVGEAVGLQVRQAARDYVPLYLGDRDGSLASLDRIRGAATMIINTIAPAP